MPYQNQPLAFANSFEEFIGIPKQLDIESSASHLIPRILFDHPPSGISPRKHALDEEDTHWKRHCFDDSPTLRGGIASITTLNPYYTNIESIPIAALPPTPSKAAQSPLTLATSNSASTPAVLPLVFLTNKQVFSDNGKRQWALIHSIGKGGCGEVFMAREVGPANADYVALKIVKDKKQYLAELNIMKLLSQGRQGRGNTPKLIMACRKRRALVMEYLGDTLSTQFQKCKFRFTLKTILILAIDMLKLCRDFYVKTGHVHVDLKPSNFCTGTTGNNLHLIDFGYSTMPEKKLPGQTGTPLFMSWTIQTYGTIEPCLQDDLESIAYILMFLMVGGKKGLPWGHLRSHKEIAAYKNTMVLTQFCNSMRDTEYQNIIPALEELLYTSRRRTSMFHDIEYQYVINSFYKTLYQCSWDYKPDYDWLEPITPQNQQ